MKGAKYQLMGWDISNFIVYYTAQTFSRDDQIFSFFPSGGDVSSVKFSNGGEISGFFHDGDHGV